MFRTSRAASVFTSSVLLGLVLYAACSMEPMGPAEDWSDDGTGGAAGGQTGSTGKGGAGGKQSSTSTNSSGGGTGTSSGTSISGAGGKGTTSTGAAGGTSSGSGGASTSTDDTTCTDYTATRVAVLTPIDSTASSLVSQMDQSNKLDLMSSSSDCPTNYSDPGCAFSSLGTKVGGTTIAKFQMRDGPRGVRGTEWGQQSTTWPVAEARAAAFDADLEYRIGKAQGEEMKALNNDLILAPVVNTLRNPRWARAQETYGEDPVLLGELGAAFVRGAQETVPACPKHFVGNDTDDNRLTTANAIADEQTLRENYTRPFEIVVKKSDPACIMAAYNEVNGVHCTENSHLLTDILRTDWQWTGFTLSDWEATVERHGAQSVKAGLDLEMPFRSRSFSDLPTGVDASLLTQAATRIVNARAKFKDLSGMSGNNAAIVSDTGHVSLAQEAEEKGAILLKNGGVLPLGSSVKTVAVVGPDYDKPVAPAPSDNGKAGFVSGLGDRGSSQTVPPHAVSFVQGLKAQATGVTVQSSSDDSAASGADVIIVPVTMAHEDEGEAYGGGADRADLTLSGTHPIHWSTKPATFIQGLRSSHKDAKIVVLLAVGSAIVMEDWIDSADAIVQTFYPGQEGGTAVARLLTGAVNFSGKLPFTVGKSEDDYPAFQNTGSTKVDYLHGYRRFEANSASPRFWFGFGLSYTQYEYSNVKILCSHVTTKGQLNFQVTVKNTGSVDGDEIVQAYIGYPNKQTSQPRPPKELKAFTRVHVAAGKSVDVPLAIPAADMAYWDLDAKQWAVEKVEHTLLVGPSADPAKLLSAPFTLE